MPIIRSKVNMVQFAVLGAAGGGGGRVTTSYQTTDTALGNGGCGSLVTATFYLPDTITLYHFVGKGGQGGRSTATAASHTTYGGDGAGDATIADNDTGGEGGEFSGIFTANSISNTNALIIAGGGGGAAGRPHGTHSTIINRSNGGGGIASAEDGHGNDGTRGNQTATLSGTSDNSAEGGQKNAGGRAGTAGGNALNTAGAGSNWYGGAGSRTSYWGNGGGGGAGLYGGGGGADDGSSWGGQGGGAGSSYIRGKIYDYSDSNLNTLTYELVQGKFWTDAWGHDSAESQHSGNYGQSMRPPHSIKAYSGFISGFSNYGKGGAATTTYAGAGGDGGNGFIAYRFADGGSDTHGSELGGWTQITSNVGTLNSFNLINGDI